MLPWEEANNRGFPWEESNYRGFFPVMADDPTKRNDRRRRRRYSFDDDESALKSVPSGGNYDYLTIDSDLTEEQLLLCSYYVFGYLMKNRKWGLFPLISSRLLC